MSDRIQARKRQAWTAVLAVFATSFAWIAAVALTALAITHQPHELLVVARVLGKLTLRLVPMGVMFALASVVLAAALASLLETPRRGREVRHA